MLIIGATALGVVRLFAVATGSIVAARLETTATVLAAQKTEQLRSLAWWFQGTGILQPVSDVTTDLSHDAPGAGGHGLSLSSASLDANTGGHVDFLDRHGQWVGTGSAPPPATVFVRRWSVTPLPASPDSLVIRVLVTTVVRDLQAVPGPRRRLAGDATVVTVLTRKAW
jgi:hypothetical protein